MVVTKEKDLTNILLIAIESNSFFFISKFECISCMMVGQEIATCNIFCTPLITSPLNTVNWLQSSLKFGNFVS